MQEDEQVIDRLQVYFEAALDEDESMRDVASCCSSRSSVSTCSTAATDGERSSSSGNVASRGLSMWGLLRVCQRLKSSEQNLLEKQWAALVILKQKRGQGMDIHTHLNYYDFLNVMFGRSKFKVSLWMYDLSQGYSTYCSRLLLGQHFSGIWHTSIVIEWGDRRDEEFWFGGGLFASRPGTTPMGEPTVKRELGHTFRARGEVVSMCAETLSREFTKANYDVLTHNCNHFTDKLSLFLLNEHIPDEVLKQPEMVMNTVTARALRPLLNHWLGGFDEDGQPPATTSGGDEVASQQQKPQPRAGPARNQLARPGAIVEFAAEERGPLLPAEVRSVVSGGEFLLVRSLDHCGKPEDRWIARSKAMNLLVAAPDGYAPEGSHHPQVCPEIEEPARHQNGCCLLC